MKKIFIILFILVISISLFVGVYADSGVSMTLAEWVELIFDTLVDTFTYFTDLGPDGFISDIWESLKKGFSDIVDNITSLGTTIRTKFNSVIQWISDLNVTIANFFRSTVTWLEDINDSLVTKLRSVVDWLRDINSTIVTKMSNLGDKIVNLGPTITSKVQSLIDKIQNLFTTDKKVDSSVVDDVISAEDAISSGVSKNFGYAEEFLDQPMSLFAQFSNGFRACKDILTAFINIPFFNNLFQFSVAIGLFGGLLGLTVKATSSAFRKGG